MEYLTIPATLSKQGLRELVAYRDTANVSPFVVDDTTYAPDTVIFIGFVGVYRAGLWHGDYRFLPVSDATRTSVSTEFHDLLAFSADKEVDNGCDT